jgi:acetyltransferase EpsM
MRPIYIIGGSGGGMIAASIVEESKDMYVEGFLNDFIPVGNAIGKYKKYPIVGTTDKIDEILSTTDAQIFVAYKTMKKERQMLEKLEKLNIPEDRFVSLFHSTAIIPHGFCSIGKGVLLAANSQLSSDTTIGNNCILFGGAFLGHDSTLERYVTVANNVSIGARVNIGAASHIGSNASIKEGVSIGKYSLIGIGAVIVKDIPENVIAVGNPARIIPKNEI